MSEEYYIMFRNSKKELKFFEYVNKAELINNLENFKHYRFSGSLRLFSKEEKNIAMIIKGEVIVPKAIEFTVTKWEVEK